MVESEIVLGLPGYQITGIDKRTGGIRIWARYTGPKTCGHCGGGKLRSKGWVERRLRYENWGLRHCVLKLQVPTWSADGNRDRCCPVFCGASARVKPSGK